ncbi:serine protease K12H4.7-like protein, partial [Aphelenchoides avenae]
RWNLTTKELAVLKEYADRRGIGRCKNTEREAGLKPSDITEGWMEQDLDHFDDSNFDNWKQRFFYTEKFYQPGSPIFLIIAGGWEESAANFATDYAAYFDYAESHRAVVYLLEHRYYGQSIPHG